MAFGIVGIHTDQIGVTRKTIKVTASQVMKWQKGLLQALSKIFSLYHANATYITVDSSLYDAWYSNGQMNLHYHAADTPEQSALIKWAGYFCSEIVAAAKLSK
jgi:hypothetical protein